MRNQTKENQIQTKLDNLSEHLSSIRADIESEGKQLTELKNRRILLEKENTDKVLKLNEDIEKNKALLAQNKQKELELRTLSEMLDIKRERLEEDVNSFEAFTYDAQIELDNKTSAAKAKEDSIKASIKLLEAERESILSSIQQTISFKKEEIEALEQQIKLLDREKDNLSIELDKVTESVHFNQFVLSELGDAIQEAKEENEEEAQKTRVVLSSIEDREDRLAVREKDFLILKERLAKVLDKLYPGQNIDNLI